MQYQRVCLENFGYVLPEEKVTSAEIEQRLAPLYERLRLPEGRLELMSGIRERRFYPPGTRPSEISIASAEKAIAASGIDRNAFGALIHGSVCRDFLEPATACRVHYAVGLPDECAIYDVSNACLGVMTGAVQIANMIELGQIKAGVVVGTERGRPLVDNTIERLNSDPNLSREDIKLSVASLTIGSASVAMVLTDESISKTKHRLVGATMHSRTSANELCQSEGLTERMRTDSERLMREGVAAGVETFERFLLELDWQREQITKTFCHQVGSAHRKMMLGALGLDSANDFATLDWLGNTGSAALPVTMAIGAEQGQLTAGDRVAMLGIGSGINSLMMGVEWNG